MKQSANTIRNKINREEIKSCLLEGYSGYEVLPKNYEYIPDLFIRLRVVYVYLDRLHRFGQFPNKDQLVTLKSLQEKVHAEIRW